ncbi:MAG: hydroxymethylglutaryl-CoA reductase, degradative [Gammaproteobacteria bacterium]|nr:hydroxymethylglutaryl-CoA reductase, degradative [Gammaproteobacteria bacterium]
MSNSRLPGFYRLNIPERIAELEKLGYLSPQSARELRAGRQVISDVTADKMIENVVGVFGMPLAIAPNFIVNGRECIVPLVVEEPSIVAALSGAAALARRTGGFSATQKESLLAGQIHVLDIADVEAGLESLRGARDEIRALADRVHPRLKARGGGASEVEFRDLCLADGSPLIVVHVLVDTCDAMGANLVNTVCEAIAPRIAEITGGRVALRILSNLADRSIATATVRFAVNDLVSGEISGSEVRDRIVLASEIASADPHRAVTHNKGVMNGIDALAIATGNDWRAIEAGAHAWAARTGSYAPLTRWSADAHGDLLGSIELPLKTGIVGGTLASNPAAAIGLEIAGVQSAMELAELMAAVGLAQNFAALRALATSGIQQGHMRLHARSLAAAAGAPDGLLEEVVDKLVASGEVKDWKAAEILAAITDVDAKSTESVDVATATAAGKIILLGEHAVVYGRHAVAVPVPDAVMALVTRSDHGTTLAVPEWGLSTIIDRSSDTGIDATVNLIRAQLKVSDSDFTIRVKSSLPRGMGLGSSAAIAVAITRAIARCMKLTLSDADLNAIAYACEQLAHGSPSGIDNTVSCYGKAVLFQNKTALNMKVLHLDEAPPLVVAFSHEPGSTLEQVAAVRRRHEKNPAAYGALFDQIDALSLAGAEALEAKRYDVLGSLMNVCHGLLNAIEVSTPDLENMVAIARENGAAGAKLTGAGGGGSIVALCPGKEDAVRTALQRSGYRTLLYTKSEGEQCG